MIEERKYGLETHWDVFDRIATTGRAFMNDPLYQKYYQKFKETSQSVNCNKLLRAGKKLTPVELGELGFTRRKNLSDMLFQILKKEYWTQPNDAVLWMMMAHDAWERHLELVERQAREGFWMKWQLPYRIAPCYWCKVRASEDHGWGVGIYAPGKLPMIRHWDCNCLFLPEVMTSFKYRCDHPGDICKSIVRCPDCRKEYFSESEACVHCGCVHQTDKKTRE